MITNILFLQEMVNIHFPVFFQWKLASLYQNPVIFLQVYHKKWEIKRLRNKSIFYSNSIIKKKEAKYKRSVFLFLLKREKKSRAISIDILK